MRLLQRHLSLLSNKLGQRGRNLGWNLAGQLLPMLTGIVFVPLLLHALGTPRFGFLSLIWVMIGYFSLFDLGLARALTQRVAELGASRGSPSKSDLPANIIDPRLRTTVATGMLLITALALISMPVLLAGKGPILDNFIHVGGPLADEAARAFIWLVLGVPVVILAAGVRGLLEGEHRFAEVNAVRTPAGMAMFIAPWLATLIAPTLAAVTFAVFAVRLLQLAGFTWLARGMLLASLRRAAIDRAEVRMLFSFGLWITVSNIVGPVLVYIDRFVLSHYGSLSAVAYYSTPFDLLARLLFVGAAVQGVMFPAVSAALATSPADVGRLLRQNYALLLLMFVPVLLLTAVFARWGLTLWLGADFAAHSAGVLRILTLGIFLNVLTGVPFGLLQSMRRADLTAKVHLVELPLYLVLLIVLVRDFGITGAAWGWVARVAFDFTALSWLAHRERRRAVPARSPVLALVHSHSAATPASRSPAARA